MATVELARPTRSSFFDSLGLPWLENGERMDAASFLERYSKTPPGFKAELIGGVVYIMPPMLSNDHGRSDSNAIGWLVVYYAATPGTAVQSNTTAILGDESVPQPDSALLILPEYGGQTRAGGPDDKYTAGAPELIVEVAYSSRSADLHTKLAEYEQAGVREYLVLDLERSAVQWFVLDESKFSPLAIEADGLLRSRVFPGLWLDSNALISGNMMRVLDVLRLGLASPEHEAFVTDLERRRAEIAGNPSPG
jgi:Uma2 family endonuclease